MLRRPSLRQRAQQLWPSRSAPRPRAPHSSLRRRWLPAWPLRGRRRRSPRSIRPWPLSRTRSASCLIRCSQPSGLFLRLRAISSEVLHLAPLELSPHLETLRQSIALQQQPSSRRCSSSPCGPPSATCGQCTSCPRLLLSTSSGSDRMHAMGPICDSVLHLLSIGLRLVRRNAEPVRPDFDSQSHICERQCDVTELTHSD
mmetsp:Transcript_9964/g.27074  ORF Transcript_9964/g.27074 Transcript_9964/m.27074 type:complete len:200 (+) Transcript_9964:599-1198(+)